MTERMGRSGPKVVDPQIFFLLAQRGAVKLEAKGLRHSSGKSVRKHMCKVLGLKQNAKPEEVLEAIEAKIEERKKELGL